jgi:hypothetical protein
VRETYTQKLSLPDYYKPKFNADELNDIVEVTDATAKQFGYDVAAIANRVAVPAETSPA